MLSKKTNSMHRLDEQEKTTEEVLPQFQRLQGSFGRYIIAMHSKEKKIVFIKKFRRNDEKSQALEEGRIMAEIKERVEKNPLEIGCENILLTEGTVMSEKSIYIIMEFLDGGNLHKLISEYKSRRKQFSNVEILYYAQQATSAIVFLHSNKILHRDIKPENLLLKKDRLMLKLGDFGQSRLLKTGDKMCETNLLSDDCQGGTRCYSAPEVLKAYPYDYKADVWSLGCVIFELVELDRAFSGDEAFVDYAIIKGELPELKNKKYSPLILGQLIVVDVNNRASSKEALQAINELTVKLINTMDIKNALRTELQHRDVSTGCFNFLRKN